MFLPTLNPIEPPWCGPVCPVVWEGRCREASSYPDQENAPEREEVKRALVARLDAACAPR
jgi:hypothetical protein